jgi:putative endonuclease
MIGVRSPSRAPFSFAIKPWKDFCYGELSLFKLFVFLRYFVYILRSIPKPHKTYIGFTSDLEKRLSQHNEGESRYTNMHKPWEIETFIAFNSKKQAENFEIYLKTGSGGAFMKRHLLKE